MQVRHCGCIVLMGVLLTGLTGCGLRATPIAPPNQAVATENGEVQAKERPSDPQTPPKEVQPAADFPFPEDRGGQLLGELLPPSGKAPANSQEAVKQPRPTAPPPAIERPDQPLPPGVTTLPRGPLAPASPPLRPRPLTEGQPLAAVLGDPAPPERPALPDAAGVRLPAV